MFMIYSEYPWDASYICTCDVNVVAVLLFSDIPGGAVSMSNPRKKTGEG